MTVKSILVIAATTVASALLAPSAHAALISGVTATTDMGTGDGNITNTVNGAGLPGDMPSLLGNHAVFSPANGWRSANGTTTGNITFDLNGTYNLAGFTFWNFNATPAINGVTVQSSTDGTNFSTIAGAPTAFAFAQSDPVSPQIFSFSSPVTASFVRFVVLNNHGAPGTTGFLEVQFDGTSVAPTTTPEPGTVLGLLAIGGGLVATRRRKG